MFCKISAKEIAEWFLNKNNYMQNITDTENITNLKLQKLLYYAQGLYLAKFNKPLFKERIIAWEHGPVVKDVYDQYKKFGGNGIEFAGSDVNFSEETECFLENVYNCFAQYSAWKLRNMTHNETPWIKTSQNAEINHSLLKDFFKDNNYGLL